MVVKNHHPLAEVIARKLHGIGGVPANEQRAMINRAGNAAVKWYERQMKIYCATLFESQPLQPTIGMGAGQSRPAQIGGKND